MALAVMVSLLAVPVAAAVGTAIHDSHRNLYAQQHHNRHLVTATITDNAAAQNISRTNTATMAARWSAAGTEHTGAVEAQSATKPGDHVAIWVDDNGALTDEPTPTTRASVDAVTAALFMWAGVTAAAAICSPAPGQYVTVSAPSDGKTLSTPWSGATRTNPASPKPAPILK